MASKVAASAHNLLSFAKKSSINVEYLICEKQPRGIISAKINPSDHKTLTAIKEKADGWRLLSQSNLRLATSEYALKGVNFARSLFGGVKNVSTSDQHEAPVDSTTKDSTPEDRYGLEVITRMVEQNTEQLKEVLILLRQGVKAPPPPLTPKTKSGENGDGKGKGNGGGNGSGHGKGNGANGGSKGNGNGSSGHCKGNGANGGGNGHGNGGGGFGNGGNGNSGNGKGNTAVGSVVEDIVDLVKDIDIPL